jgi:hypothetical protein
MESEDRMAGSRELTHQRFFQIIKKMWKLQLGSIWCIVTSNL